MVKEKTSKKKVKESETKETAKSKKLSQKDFEKKVLELAKQGLTSEKIGEELKKQGIHSNDYDKKISKILKENDVYVNADVKNIEEKYKNVKNHFEKNKQDKRAKREKDRLFSQLRKIKKYFGYDIR